MNINYNVDMYRKYLIIECDVPPQYSRGKFSAVQVHLVEEQWFQLPGQSLFIDITL